MGFTGEYAKYASSYLRLEDVKKLTTLLPLISPRPYKVVRQYATR